MSVQDWNKNTLAYEVPAYSTAYERSTALIHMVNDSHGRIKDGEWDGSAAMCGEQAPAQDSGHKWMPSFGFATCPACLRAYIAGGGKGWFLPLNAMSIEREASIDHALQTLQAAHFTNFAIRKDGQDLVEEADWVKNLRKL